ncbi:MAG: Fe-S protein assembly co-chaperone HscB [Gammaproteobacteria bacterium]|nr:Fe-S protein assembly co-chaperone HscB [Gammaproteobacteria bacterium]
MNDNDFALFGLPVAFTLDVAVLTTRYRELQRAVHPDRFVQAGEAERLLAVRQAARINDAYQHLKTPLARAQYLLTLHGHGLVVENSTLKDPEFLLEQMELREALSEADSAALTELQSQIDARVLALVKALELGFTVAQPDWPQLQVTVLKLQFMHKLRNEAELRAERLLGM